MLMKFRLFPRRAIKIFYKERFLKARTRTNYKLTVEASTWNKWSR